MSFFKKVFRPVEKVVGGVGALLGLNKQDMPIVDVSEATTLLSENAEADKKKRLKQLYTQGGIAGEEVAGVNQYGRNLFGN